MKTQNIVISIFSLSLLFLSSRLSYSDNKQIDLEIQPSQIFVGEDSSIIFRAHFNSPSTKPSTLTLVEWNENGKEIKYHWELKDEGTQGDEKAGDGIYSRVIQFKESKIKTLSFWVSDEKLGENTNPTSVFLHKPSPQFNNPAAIPENQKATLNIISRPTFQEILRDAYRKVMDKFK